MRDKLKSILKKVLPAKAKRDLVSLGFHLDQKQFQILASDYLFAPNMELGIESLKRRGFNPGTILDVGAFEGNWAKMAAKCWPDSNLILIEGNPEKIEGLLTSKELNKAHVLHALLGSEEGREVIFHVMESGSSVLEENSPVRRKQVNLPLRTMDNVLKGLAKPDFIKLDVQGYELEVLRGGRESVSSAKAVLLELSLIEINEGAPILHEALSFMYELGFVAFDIFEIHRRPLDGAMNQLDILFVPEYSDWRKDKRHWA